MANAPIVVFAYRRPDKLRSCLEHLARCPEAEESRLIIYVDGPKDERELPDVGKTCEVAERAIGFREVTVKPSPYNRGLANSIISGVTSELESSDKVIVVEDDLEVAPGFLTFMNDALLTYESTPEVISVHGYCYPTKDSLPEMFFLRGADCWGWATWRRGWKLFEPSEEVLLDQLRSSSDLSLFNFNGSYNYLDMLISQIKGKTDSWAIRWYASAFLANKLTLYPGQSLVHNTGLDGSGTHGKGDRSHDVSLASSAPDVVWQYPVESTQARQAFESFFRSLEPKRGGGLLDKVKKVLAQNSTRQRRG